MLKNKQEKTQNLVLNGSAGETFSEIFSFAGLFKNGYL